YVWGALQAGGGGGVLEKAGAAELGSALEAGLKREVYLSRENAERLPETLARDGIPGQKRPLEQLSSRQREVLQLIAEGQNTKQIADMLKISPKTVEYHRIKLMDALNVHDVPGLVRFALRVGLVHPEP